jgi:hypothetical protein
LSGLPGARRAASASVFDPQNGSSDQLFTGSPVACAPCGKFARRSATRGLLDLSLW